MSGVPKSGPKPSEIQTLSEIWCFLILCIGAYAQILIVVRTVRFLYKSAKAPILRGLRVCRASLGQKCPSRSLGFMPPPGLLHGTGLLS